MTARMLIEKILNACDITLEDLVNDDADGNLDREVYMAHQPNYPFELTIADVVSRSEIMDAPEEDDDDNSASQPRDFDGSRCSASRNDILLVEGRQIRYGSRDLWR